MTSTGQLLTVVNLLFAVANVAAGVAIGQPGYIAVMLGFLLLCQMGITWWESTESAEQECREVTSILRDNRRSPAADTGTSTSSAGGLGSEST